MAEQGGYSNSQQELESVLAAEEGRHVHGPASSPSQRRRREPAAFPLTGRDVTTVSGPVTYCPPQPGGPGAGFIAAGPTLSSAASGCGVPGTLPAGAQHPVFPGPSELIAASGPAYADELNKR